MADRPFESMARARQSEPAEYDDGNYRLDTQCQRCLGYVQISDWPWCTGDPMDQRPVSVHAAGKLEPRT